MVQYRIAIFITVIVLIALFSGCTGGQDITTVTKNLPEIQQFLKEHPNAKITTTYWSKEEIEKMAQEISKQCDKPITPVAMYKATISDGDLKIVSWINEENQKVICSITESKGLQTNTSAPTPTATLISSPTLTATMTPAVTPTSTVTPTPQITPVITTVSTIPVPVADQKTFTNSIGVEFILIPAGEFEMGNDFQEFFKKLNENEITPITKANFEPEEPFEGPVHHVTLAKAFYMGKYEVTQKQWHDVMGTNPSYFLKGDNLPVVMVSWNDVQEFIKKLNENESTDKYRLPSEAEWEYSARAGTTTIFSFGDDASELGDYAWYVKNSNYTMHPVGQKKPNPWGLYDMHGNVWEWVQDKWHATYDGAPIDGSAWESGNGNLRTERGGNWKNPEYTSRSGKRVEDPPDGRYPALGFRLVRDV